MRSLSRSPGFVLVAVACLGLALALNTTTFAILDAMLHPSLPVRHAEQLFYVSFWPPRAGSGTPEWERYEVLRAGKFYEEISFFERTRATVRTGAGVRDEGVYRVSGNFYSLLGVRPELGRLLGSGTPEDAAVVSHGFWEGVLGGRSLDGLTVWVNERAYRVLGVLPAAMTFPWMEVAIPLPRASEQVGAGVRNVVPVIRVRRGVTGEGLNTQLAALARRLPSAIAFVPHAIAPVPQELGQVHFAMAGAAFLVLLIAGANVASLMLVRGAGKRREIALRLALGAGRRALVRHLIAEAAVIAAAGLVAGLLLTLWAIPALGSLMPPSVSWLGIVTPRASWRVFAFGGALALGTATVVGVWPALRASDVDVSEPLKDSASVVGKARWRYHPVVIVEIALCLVLLMGVALLTRAAGRVTGRLSASMLGFDRRGLLDARVSLGAVVPADSARRISGDLLTRLAAFPEVGSVAAVGKGEIRTVTSEFYHGFNGVLGRAPVFPVSDGFLRTLGIPVLQGRDFVPGDELTGAAIVDDVVASALWPDGHAVGRLINLGRLESGGPWVRVVGVARRALVRGPTGDPHLAPEGVVYRAWQPGTGLRGWQLAIRTSGPEGPAAVALRHAIRDALPGGRGLYVEPWLWEYDDGLRVRYFLLDVFAAFGAFALTLATVGLYGVVWYAVSQRMREFAVRVAMGAPRREVMKLVAHDAAAMTLAGIGLGAFLAMWGSTLLGDWLYDVYHTDALALVIAEAVLLAAAFTACLQPALRALRADPVEILRAI